MDEIELIFNHYEALVNSFARLFLWTPYFQLSFDDIESLVSNGGLVTITDRNQKSSVDSLQKQFDLVQNEKLAHLLHLAKYDENFTKFGDSYKNLYYHTSTAKGKKKM